LYSYLKINKFDVDVDVETVAVREQREGVVQKR
jgi:hypothetical protein